MRLAISPSTLGMYMHAPRLALLLLQLLLHHGLRRDAGVVRPCMGKCAGQCVLACVRA